MNRLPRWMLADQPFGRRMSKSLIALRIRGRLTGRLRTFSVQYAAAGDRLVVMPGHHETKTWWRNFLTRRTLEVRSDGTWSDAYAWVIWPRDADYGLARDAYTRRWPTNVVEFGQPLVRIRFIG